MITSLAIQEVVDVGTDAGWPLFANYTRSPGVVGVPGISMIEIEATSDGRLASPVETLDACVDAASDLLFGSTPAATTRMLWLLLLHDWARPQDRITAYKRLWRGRAPLPDGLIPGIEVGVGGPERVRYAAVARVNPAGLLAAMHIVQAEHTLMLFTGHDINQPAAVLDLCRTVFPDDQWYRLVDWAGLALRRCPLGDVLVRCGTDQDGRIGYVHFVMSTSLLPQFRGSRPVE